MRHKIICDTRINLENQEVMHGPSVHGCVFCDSLRGSEGLNIDLHLIKRYISEGNFQSITQHTDIPPHIVISLCG